MGNLIAITGGIGSGKSIVARLLTAMGHEVYDCDSRARELMNTPAVREQLAARFGPDVYDSDGHLIASRLAAQVFDDEQAHADVNAIVHPAVKHDVLRWAAGRDVAFVETALLEQAHMRPMVDAVWQVTAPVEVRIARVMQRMGATAQEVRQRIAAQRGESHILVTDKVIVNDNRRAVLPQVVALLATITPASPSCN